VEARPLSIVPIHDYLQMHLCDLYENDCIFDKFECASSNDGSRFVTGSYNNNFVIHNCQDKTSVTIEALKDPPKAKPVPPLAPPASKTPKARKNKNVKVKGNGNKTSGDAQSTDSALSSSSTTASLANSISLNNNSISPSTSTSSNNVIQTNNQQDSPNVNLMDFGKKALHVAWHPHQNAIAVAGLNKLYLYQA